ncbi:MAG: FkbM family methyltransferase [Candidatus Omnitrophica bacterium]|nr:FkbM family methyltransferase [Candidatus Omnitrophota bacterium]
MSFGNVVKKLFYAFGFTIRRSKISRTMLKEVLDHVQKFPFKPKTVIDIGVGYGTPVLYEAFKEATFLLIEPLKEYEDVLQKIVRRYQGSYVLAAAGKKRGNVILHVHPVLSSSSLYEESEGRQADGSPREVPMVTLDELCSEKKLSGPYLVKIDTQGGELDVLEGARGILKETEVVLLEVSLLPLFKNGPQLYDVVSAMKRWGFVVYDVFNTHHRPLDHALAQVDMAFVREDGLFRKTPYYATEAQRETFNLKKEHFHSVE